MSIACWHTLKAWALEDRKSVRYVLERLVFNNQRTPPSPSWGPRHVKEFAPSHHPAVNAAQAVVDAVADHAAKELTYTEDD